MIRLEGVTAGYHRIPAIKEINLVIKQAEITTIVGPNGSGKSTLLKVTAGLCDLMDGRLYLKGQERKVIGEKQAARFISYLPQSHSLPAITVGRMVLHGRFPWLSYPRKYRAADYEACHRAMERLGILALKDKRVAELSGGERQKVYLAMALAGGTEIFLFDEPATYLDIRYQLDILRLMEELKGQGKTIITVMHDLDAALRISDTVALMQEGRLVQYGPAVKIGEMGVLEEVFQVSAESFIDERGKKRYYFEPR